MVQFCRSRNQRDTAKKDFYQGASAETGEAPVSFLGVVIQSAVLALRALRYHLVLADCRFDDSSGESNADCPYQGAGLRAHSVVCVWCGIGSSGYREPQPVALSSVIPPHSQLIERGYDAANDEWGHRPTVGSVPQPAQLLPSLGSAATTTHSHTKSSRVNLQGFGSPHWDSACR